MTAWTRPPSLRPHTDRSPQEDGDRLSWTVFCPAGASRPRRGRSLLEVVEGARAERASGLLDERRCLPPRSGRSPRLAGVVGLDPSAWSVTSIAAHHVPSKVTVLRALSALTRSAVTSIGGCPAPRGRASRLLTPAPPARAAASESAAMNRGIRIVSPLPTGNLRRRETLRVDSIVIFPSTHSQARFLPGRRRPDLRSSPPGTRRTIRQVTSPRRALPSSAARAPGTRAEADRLPVEVHAASGARTVVPRTARPPQENRHAPGGDHPAAYAKTARPRRDGSRAVVVEFPHIHRPSRISARRRPSPFLRSAGKAAPFVGGRTGPREPAPGGHRGPWEEAKFIVPPSGKYFRPPHPRSAARRRNSVISRTARARRAATR